MLQKQFINNAAIAIVNYRKLYLVSQNDDRKEDKPRYRES